MTAVAISTNFATRPRYHREITSGVKAKSEDVVFFGEPFKNVPHKLNAKYGEFPMTKRGDPDLQALRELISEGVAGLDEETLQKAVTLAFADGEIQLKTRSIKDIQQSVPKTPDLTLVKDKIGRGDQLNNAERSEVIKLGFRIWKTYNPSITNYMIMRAAKKTYARQAKPNVGQFASRFSSTWVTSGNATQWMVRTDREESAAKPLVNKIFDQMYREIDHAQNYMYGRILAICKAIRALHTAHIYVDANGRLNTMLLLTRLLMEIGCPRVYLKDTSVFGGSATAKQLADQVVAKLPNPLQSVIWRQFAVQQIVDPTWANDLPL